MLIMLLGVTGQVGFELERSLATMGEVASPTRSELDLLDPKAVEECLDSMQPELIVNAAAWTAVDEAENQQEVAMRLNAGLPAQLAKYAKDKGIRLVHYSSDYVYPGYGVTPWQETSNTRPLNVYGYTKLEGDNAIELSGADYLIFRTSWVYSARGNNFMKTMLSLAEGNLALKIVADQIGAPTPARLIAQITLLALHSRLKTGVYHLASRGEISWHGFAQEIFRMAQQAGPRLPRSVENVNPVSTNAYPTVAKRPLNSRLDVRKLEAALNIQLPTWENQLALTIKEFLEMK